MAAKNEENNQVSLSPKAITALKIVLCGEGVEGFHLGLAVEYVIQQKFLEYYMQRDVEHQLKLQRMERAAEIHCELQKK